MGRMGWRVNPEVSGLEGHIAEGMFDLMIRKHLPSEEDPGERCCRQKQWHMLRPPPRAV